jgi:hypothetical protein
MVTPSATLFEPLHAAWAPLRMPKRHCFSEMMLAMAATSSVEVGMAMHVGGRAEFAE